MKPLLFIKDLAGKLILSLRRFPDTIALAVATVVVMIYLNHSTGIMEQEQRELLTRIAMILSFRYTVITLYYLILGATLAAIQMVYSDDIYCCDWEFGPLLLLLTT